MANRRMRILIGPLPIPFIWLCLLALAIYTNVVGWFAAQDLGDARWMQYPLIQLGFTIGLIADDLSDRVPANTNNHGV